MGPKVFQPLKFDCTPFLNVGGTIMKENIGSSLQYTWPEFLSSKLTHNTACARNGPSYASQGGESRGINDRVYGISCR